MASKQLPKWWDNTQLRSELLETSGQIADVQMSLRGVAYGIGGKYPLYRDVDYFGEITHPSPSLIRVAADIAVRLGGEGGQAASGRPVWRFDQGMGGGKSHALVALYHLASDPDAFAKTDVGELILGEAKTKIGSGKIGTRLGSPIVVALPGDHMSPGKPDPDMFGGATSLWERFLFRLYEGDHERWVADKDTTSYDQALRNVERPVLILFDEVMHYLRAATSAGATEQAVKDQEFLIKIMRDTNEVDHCVAVIVMIDSDKDPIALSEFGEKCRRELEEEAERGEVRGDAVTSPNDFASIIRRRLFEELPTDAQVRAVANTYTNVMSDKVWNSEVFSRLRSITEDFTTQVERAYPFHPALIHLAEQEWAQVAGFQRVRSTIRVFAASIYAHLKRLAEAEGITVTDLQADPSKLSGSTWAPELIGPGDIVLSDPDVREALLDSGLIVEDKTTQNYRQVIATDIVDEDDASGNARKIDLAAADNPARGSNPRAAERLATATLLYSISDRPQGGQGASVPEAVAATFVPDLSFGYGDAEVVLESIRDPKTGLASLDQIPGKGGQPPRLYLSTKKTFGMFFRDALNAIGDKERDQAVADRAEKLMTSGPFDGVEFVSRQDKADALTTINAASIDQSRKNRLFVLDPTVFTLLNGDDSETRAAVRAAMGLGENKLTVNWASSAVFAVVNTYRRRNALVAAGDYLAAKRVASRDSIRNDSDLKEQAYEDLKAKEAEFDKQVKAAFQHIVWLADVGNNTRDWADHRFEGDLETALNGSHVWKVLQTREKAYGPGEFDGDALLHNLRDSDYGKPLSELRDDFWRVPRLSLLPDGEKDLKAAIWQALHAGRLRIMSGTGEEVEAFGQGDLNLSSDSMRLAEQAPTEPKTSGDDEDDEEGGGHLPEPELRDERRVSLAGTLSVTAENRDSLRVAFDALRNAIDEGHLSWIQVSLKAIIDVDGAPNVAPKAIEAGLAATQDDL